MFALSWHISWNKVLKVFSKTWWEVVQWAMLLPPAAPHRQAPAATGSQNLGFHAVIMCCTPCVLGFQPWRSPGSLVQSHMEALGSSVSLWHWPDFTSSKNFLHPLVLFQKGVVRHTHQGWSLSKVTIWSTRLSCLVCYNFWFIVIPKDVTNSRAECCLGGFVSFKGVISSRKYHLSLSWSSSSTSKCCDHTAWKVTTNPP